MQDLGQPVEPEVGDDHVMNQQETQTDVHHRLRKHARRDLDRYLNERFQVGDHVRIKLTALDSRQRKKLKEMKGKYVTPPKCIP